MLVHQKLGIILENKVVKKLSLEKNILKIPTRNASSSKIGHILENKVVQKLSLEKNDFYKKWSPKLIFLIFFFNLKAFNKLFITSE